MNINTKHFGIVDVEENEQIHFEHGLPGFENYHTYVLLPVDEKGIYLALQSVDEAGIALVVTNPYLFLKDYEFDLHESTTTELNLVDLEDVGIYNVLTLREPFNQSTINLQAPIVINMKTKKGKQIILNDDRYQTRHPFVAEQKGGVQNARP